MPRKPISTRKLALDVLHEWNKGQDYAAILIDEAARDLDLPTRDTALLQSLVLGVLRNQSLLDHWSDMLTQGKELDRDTRDALRLGLVQLHILDMPAYAAVNETVEYAGKAGALVNAVLRRSQREQRSLIIARDEAPLHIRTSHPEWLVQRWTEQLGEAMATSICEANQTQSPTYVRINKLHKPTPQFDYVRDCGDGFFEVDSLPYEAIKSGAVYVQDPSTAIAPTLLAPTPSTHVLDMCAAPGGKTAIMAQMMRNDGRIIATDSSPKRVTRLTANLERLGALNVTPMAHDWIKNPKGPKENKKYDRILIDVPCSNTGVMRRRVDVRWRLKPEDFVSLGETQKQLLDISLTLLNPGGIIVYSTCSIDAVENEGMIKQAIDAHRELAVIDKKQTFPHRDGIDGSFAAALKMA